MSDELLKVIAGLECCSPGVNGCGMCPYRSKVWTGECLEELLSDALKILREVESDGLY